MPCYQLTKTETLYIATKFNDEARARLVLRWEELELERLDFGTDSWTSQAAKPSDTDLHGLIKSSDDNNSCNSRNSCQEKIRVNPCNPCQIINH